MAYANSAISDIIATTIESRTRDVADNLTANNALLRRLDQRGNIKPISGGSVILQELFYNDPSTNFASSYSGYDTINISPDSPISAAQFNNKFYADAVTISGPEILQNSGREQMIDLMTARIEVAESRLRNLIDYDLHGNGTGNGGKAIDGLGALFTTSPTTGTYGGINRANWQFWQPGYFTGTTTVGAPTTAATIQSAMNVAALSIVRGTDHADLIYAGLTAYQQYVSSLQAIQRVVSDGEGMAGAGFTALKYYGGGQSADVVLGGGIGGNANSNYMYFINTKFLHFRPHKDRNFVPIGGDRQAVNQDAVVRLIGWAGNLTSSGVQYQSLLNTGA